MSQPERLPIKVDRITARVLQTLSPTRRNEIENRMNDFRRYGNQTSLDIKLDTVDLAHPQINGVSMKVTSKRVETYVHLKGATIKNGRLITIPHELPESMTVCLGKKAANDVVGTDLLEGHTILYARDQDIFLKEEEWIPFSDIIATGQDVSPISVDEFYNRLRELGIEQVDAVLVKYISRINKRLHIALGRIEARCQDEPDTSATSSTLHDLTDYSNGERAFFSVTNGTINFTLESPSGNARYSAGRLSCWSSRLSYSAQHVEMMCSHMRRQTQGKNRSTKFPYRTIDQIFAERAKYKL